MNIFLQYWKMLKGNITLTKSFWSKKNGKEIELWQKEGIKFLVSERERDFNRAIPSLSQVIVAVRSTNTENLRKPPKLISFEVWGVKKFLYICVSIMYKWLYWHSLIDCVTKEKKKTDGQEKDFTWTLHSSFYVEIAFSFEESKTWDLAKGNAWENGK